MVYMRLCLLTTQTINNYNYSAYEENFYSCLYGIFFLP